LKKLENSPINNKISGIIFSRDRAMQLDAVLRSFFLHCLDSELIKISILYMVSDENHARQYKTLMVDHPQVTFIEQTNFRQDVIHWLDPYVAGSCAAKKYFALDKAISVVRSIRDLSGKFKMFASQRLQKFLAPQPQDLFYLFLVDDNLFIRDFSLNHVVHILQGQPRALGFSLRLGMNTTYCYSYDSAQSLPKFEQLSGGALAYEWVSDELDFGYPLEISSSVYRAQEIVPFLLGLEFDSPNTLEGEMAAQAHRFKNKFPLLVCYEKSIAFCNPINLVQTTHQNRSGHEYNYTIQELLERFDRGERVSVVAYTGFTTNACHQEVELYFEQAETRYD
jgi:hypothetical protein